MFASATHRPLVGIGLGLALAALSGCGGVGQQEISGSADGNVMLVASPISHSTLVPFFSMGHDLDYLPFGGIGVLKLGTTWTASIEFVNVPEGKYVPRYDGYSVLTQNIFSVGTLQSYCEVEWGLDVDQLSVTSGGNNRADIALSPVSGCDRIGVDRFITNPTYEFDPQHRFAGSTDGENIVAVYVDGVEPFTDVEFLVCDEDVGQDCEAAPFGVFPDLPDPPITAWPDPAIWESESMLIPSDSDGDLVGYLVVKPGAMPTYWEVRFEDESDNIEAISLRVSNMNKITLTAP